MTSENAALHRTTARATARATAAGRRLSAAIAGLVLCGVLAACGGAEQPEPPKPVLDEAAMRLRMMSAGPVESAASAASAAGAAASADSGTAAAAPVYTALPTLAWAMADGRVLVCGEAGADLESAPSGCELWSTADGLHTAIGDAGAQVLRADATPLAASSPASAHFAFAATGGVAADALPRARFMALVNSPRSDLPTARLPADAAPGVWLLFATDAAGHPVAASRVRVQASTPAGA